MYLSVSPMSRVRHVCVVQVIYIIPEGIFDIVCLKFIYFITILFN